ncbi:hypothetical protein L1987_46662 [Smallanthus sonchifolius]|uniref:Uncharacterized protein n=1 Tax=Smallanthus sonchifolius TaxID=185202 RepID=A0ACB9G0E4_9ASTR|nr:hypothetical protein L1987_46662 [Smallanthus sonchifolius]
MAPSCRSFIQNMRFILHRISPFNHHLRLLSVVSNAEGFNPSFAYPQNKLTCTNEALPLDCKALVKTIVQMRTVLAYVGESRALRAYSSALKISQRLGYKSGFSKGY